MGSAPTEPVGVAAPFFALRTPLLPFDVLERWTDGLRAATALDGDVLADAWAADRLALRERLRALTALPEVREALFVASPNLEANLQKWLDHPDSAAGLRLERALARYLQRMAFRSTPFGLFAGCSTGEIGGTTRLRLAPRAEYRRHTRLDGDYLDALTRTLASDCAVRRTLVYRPNSSLYRLGCGLRWVETIADGESGGRVYDLAGADGSAYLDAALARAADGVHFDDLVQSLVDHGLAREDADALVAEMVDTQLLVSDLAPLVTGAEPVEELVAQLARQAETRSAAATLDAAHAALADLDKVPLGVPCEVYRKIAASLEALPVGPRLERAFQVDLIKPAPEARLAPEVVREIERGVRVLQRIRPPARTTALDRFRRAFVERYEAQELLLADVLDAEYGLGFETAPGAGAISPLLDGLNFPDQPSPEEPATTSVQTRWLMRRLEQVVRSGGQELVLDEGDLAKLECRDPRNAPASFAAVATLSATSDEAMARGDFLVNLRLVNGPTGVNFLGRFCHGDGRLKELVRDYLGEEEAQRPDVVYAEIVHLPKGRIGNIIVRPLLRGHEIPYLGRSGAPREQQLPVDDLLVSVRGERIVLRSRRLGREVVPRMTNVHNYAPLTNLGVYRFLCALSRQGGEDLRFNWGVLANAPSLPRVRTGRSVLSLAQWQLYADELEPLREAGGMERWRHVQALRRARELPRWVALVDGDNELPVDLDNPLSVETFSDLVGKRSGARLVEIFDVEGLCARGPEGRFRHELIVPFTSRQGAGANAGTVSAGMPPARVVESAAERVAPATRTRAVGSEWLYLKLYAGARSLDALLTAVSPAVQAALSSGAADSWFFLRYGDPDWHLRVRVHGDPRRLAGEVLPELSAVSHQLLDEGRVRKIQLDTYEREIERYGGHEGTLIAEQIFCADSEAVLGIVELMSADEEAEARWRLTLRGMDMLLDALGFTFDEKRAVVSDCRHSFAREHQVTAPLTRQIGDKFRRVRASLEELLDPALAPGSSLAPGLALLERRSAQVRPLADRLRGLAATGRLTRPLPELAASYLHMHANRLLQPPSRAQELVIHDFLARLYDGAAHRRQGPTSARV